MEDSSLNRAHQLYRKAESYLKKGKYERCIECHKKAIDLLTETLLSTKHPRAIESMKLQIQYHENQIEKMSMMRRNQKAEEKKKKEMLQSKDTELEAAIYKTIETHDSLVEYLGRRGGSDNGSVNSFNGSELNDQQGADNQVMGNKHPKSDAMVIEELKELSGQLRESIQILLLQLDDRNKEIERLNTTIEKLKNKKQKDESINDLSLKVATDSSGGTSPYVFSPCSELSPEVGLQTRSLPPLEMPNFDFLNLNQQ